MDHRIDYLVIGAGISGASVAFELSRSGATTLIEAEAAPGYHSTGRSAALYTPNFGNALVRSINQASSGFFRRPPAGFNQTPLLTPRGALTIATPGDEQALVNTLALGSEAYPIHEIPVTEALSKAPLLRPERISAAVYEPGVDDIDVHALHQCYLRGFKANGGTLICSERVTALQHSRGSWRVNAGSLSLSARVVINAAGAWAAELGAMAKAHPVQIMPRRRTAMIVDASALGHDLRSMPLVDHAGRQPYMKPDGDRLMASLGDETLSEAVDVQAEELDVALLVDWLETETVLEVGRVDAHWAGLRSFAADGSPVLGFDSKVPDFFWLAGQGGYGIMMAPTLSKLAAQIIIGVPVSDDYAAIDLELLSPMRSGAHGVAVARRKADGPSSREGQEQ